MQMVMAQKFFILFGTNAIVNQHQLFAILYQQAAHGPRAQVVGIGRIGFLPNGFGYYAKHGTAI
jgi:hypothetical protein